MCTHTAAVSGSDAARSCRLKRCGSKSRDIATAGDADWWGAGDDKAIRYELALIQGKLVSGWLRESAFVDRPQPVSRQPAREHHIQRVRRTA